MRPVDRFSSATLKKKMLLPVLSMQLTSHPNNWSRPVYTVILSLTRAHKHTHSHTQTPHSEHQRTDGVVSERVAWRCDRSRPYPILKPLLAPDVNPLWTVHGCGPTSYVQSSLFPPETAQRVSGKVDTCIQCTQICIILRMSLAPYQEL